MIVAPSLLQGSDRLAEPAAFHKRDFLLLNIFIIQRRLFKSWKYKRALEFICQDSEKASPTSLEAVRHSTPRKNKNGQREKELEST